MSAKQSEKNISKTKIQSKIFSIVKKHSFTKSNMIKIIRNLIKTKKTSKFSSYDILDFTVENSKTYFIKSIMNLYKQEKVIPSYTKKLSTSRLELVNKYYKIFSEDTKFNIPKSSFEYIFNTMLSRISKDIKQDILSKLNISKNGDIWDATDYAKRTRILETNQKQNNLEEDKEVIKIKEPSIIENKISIFRQYIIDDMVLKTEEEFHQAENKLTDSVINDIVKENFDNDIDKAIAYISGNYEEYQALIKEHIKNIEGFNKAVSLIMKNIVSKKKILGIGDVDLDGSSFLAIGDVFKEGFDNEYSNNLQFEYSETLPDSNMSHGLNIAHIKKLIKNNVIVPEEISLLMTGDNGISLTIEEVEGIFELLPNAELLITDHHLPTKDIEEVIQKYPERVTVFDPKYKPNEYFSTEKNISGAQTAGELFLEALERLENIEEIEVFDIFKTKNIIESINRASNMWDVVNSDITQYIHRSYLSDKLSSIGTLMNTINSMKTFIGQDLNVNSFSKLFNIEPKEADTIIKKLLYLNSLSKEFFILYQEIFTDEDKLLDLNDEKFDKIFNDLFMEFELSKDETNYISLLRPIIIALENNKYKDIFLAKFSEKSINIFKELKSIETILIEKIRENPNNFIEDIKKYGLESENVLFMVMKNSKELKEIFVNRKLLGKAFTAPKKFKTIYDNIEKNKISGSARSFFKRSDIFSNINNIVEILDIFQMTKGHENAFGYSIEFLNKNLSKKDKFRILSDLIKWIDLQIENEKEIQEEKSINSEIVELIPTSQAKIVMKINEKIKSNFPGKKGIPTNIYFNEYELENFEKQLGDDINGWITLDTRIMDNTLIIEKGLLKEYISLRKKGIKCAINFSSISSGALICNYIRQNPNDIILESDNHLVPLYKKYQEEHFHNNKEHLNNSELSQRPYFKLGKFGDIEFRRTEAIKISMMYELGLNSWNTLDLEGTGLNMSSLITEISISSHKIDPSSGHKIEENDFKKRSFIVNGREVLVDNKDIPEFQEISEEEVQKYEPRNIFFNQYEDKIYFNPTNNFYPEIFSKKFENGIVIYNQQLVETHVHAYISDLVNNISSAIESLTHLQNGYIKNAKNSLTLKETDELFSKFLKEQGFALLSAHNLPYDYSLIRSNLPKTFATFKNLLLWDSAKASQALRLNSQSYGSITLPTNIGDLRKPTVVFENRIGNGISISEFFDKIENGDQNIKIEISDKDLKYFLKVKEGNLVFIDSVKDIEVILYSDIFSIDVNVLKENLQFKPSGVSVAPKYSVQSVLTEKYVKMMLAKIYPVNSKKYNLTGINGIPISHTDIVFGDMRKTTLFENELKEFLSKYRFENSISNNINTFIGYIEKKYINLPNFEAIVKHLIEDKMPFIAEPEIKPTSRVINKYYKTMYEQFLDNLEITVNKFIFNNKKISAQYTNRFHMAKIISYFPDNLNRINNTLIKNISHITSYEEELIQKTVDIVKKFEKINGVNIFSIAEIHNNLIGKIAEHMGDSDIENDLVITQILNEHFNHLNNNKQNLLNSCTDFIKHKIIDTAKMDFNKQLKEDITTAQINTMTYREGLAAVELNSNGYLSDFAKKIQETSQGKRKYLVKVNESLVQDNTLVYIDTEDTADKKEINKIVSELDMYLFLSNLKNSKENIEKYLINTLEKNTKNIIGKFSLTFKEYIEKNKSSIEKKYKEFKAENPNDKDKTFRFFTMIHLPVWEDFNKIIEKLEENIISFEDIIKNNPDDINAEEIKEVILMKKSTEDFLSELINLYQKVNSFNMIEDLEKSIKSKLELPEKEFLEKYNISFDFFKTSRQFKIVDELFELLQEMFESDSESFDRIGLSSKFGNRRKKSLRLQYIEPKEAEEFITNTLDKFKTLVKRLNLPEEYLTKISSHLDILFKYYFINENMCEITREHLIEEYSNNTIEYQEKSFRNPSSVISEAFSNGLSSELAKYVIDSKISFIKDRKKESIECQEEKREVKVKNINKK